MTSGTEGVAGTHKPTFSPQWLFWGVVGVVSAGMAVAHGIERKWTWVGITSLLVASAIVNLLRLLTAGQTIIGPKGVRVRRGLGWRDFSWDEVTSIERRRNIFGYDEGVWIETTGSDELFLSVPPQLRDALVAYAEAHRTRRPPGSEPTEPPPRL
jgi:hypothetical protein